MEMDLHNSTLETIYPRQATIMAAVCAVIFSVVGVLGKFKEFNVDKIKSTSISYTYT